jgi:hypothetical protein
MSAKSRRKGKNGELEAALVMSALTSTRWIRTAQRHGKATADIEPEPPNRSMVHVEVKRYQGGLEWWTRRVKVKPKTVWIDEVQGIYFCAVTAFRTALAQDQATPKAPTQRSVKRWLDKAHLDCIPEMVPMVLCRQDNGPWMMAWRVSDDDKLIAALKESVAKRCDACAGTET